MVILHPFNTHHQVEAGRAEQPTRILPARRQRHPGPVRGGTNPAEKAGEIHIEPEAATL